MSFMNIITALHTVLSSDSALTTFCQSNFGKALTVKKYFLRRVEVQESDLPIIFITRPEKSAKDYPIGGREQDHIIRLYCGFKQTDKTVALQNSIAMEEAIESAILGGRGTLATSGAVFVDPKGSMNDEGYYHPIYFTVKDVEITTRF